MGRQTININDSATKMANDINANFGELYQGAGGGTVAGLPTKRVKVWDVMGRSGGGSGNPLDIPCNIKSGDKFYITRSQNGSNYQLLDVYFLDSQKSVSTRQTALQTNGSYVVTTGGWGEEVTATRDYAYIRINGYASSKINVYHYEDVFDMGNRWLDKKWLVIGDSISTEHADEAQIGYAELVAKALGMLRENIAASGKTSDYFIGSVNNWADDYDLITVMLGTNNHGYNIAVGSLSDNPSSGTFVGNMQLFYEQLRLKYPKSVIAFITPIKRYLPDGSVYINGLGLSTEPYAQAVRDICAHYSIPCIDIYNSIDPSTQTARDNFFLYSEAQGAHDGTHPNDLGHALFIAPIVEARLRDIAPFYFNDWEALAAEQETGE